LLPTLPLLPDDVDDDDDEAEQLDEADDDDDDEVEIVVGGPTTLTFVELFGVVVVVVFRLVNVGGECCE
jgi:hypothetical protein